MRNSRQPDPPSGVYAALATPRRANSVDVDCAAMLDYLDGVVRAGVDGLVLFGSTGEFPHFDIAERNRVITLAMRRSRVPVLVNVSHSTIEGVIELADHAMSFGAAGLFVMPPYFFRYSEAQIGSFYRRLRREIDSSVRLYLYNIPQFTNWIPVRLAGELLRNGGYSGIKDSSGDWDYFEQLLALRRASKFSLLAGNERILLRALPAGADGAVSGVCSACPELVVEINRACVEGNTDLAATLNGRLHEFLDWVDRFPATIAIKRAASLRNWPLNHSAIPLDDETCAELRTFEQWFQEWWPAVLGECSRKVMTHS